MDLVSNGISLGSNPASAIGNKSIEEIQKENGSEYTALADLISTFAPASVGTQNLQDGSVTNEKIANLSFNKAFGQALTLGGSSNGNGILKVENNVNQLIIQEDNQGIHFYNTPGNEVVRIDNLGIHNYNGSGTVLTELTVAGLEIYGTSASGSAANLTFLSGPGGTHYGVIGVGSGPLNFIFGSVVGSGIDSSVYADKDLLLTGNHNIQLAVGTGAIYFYGQSFVISSPTVITNNGAQAQVVSGGFTKTAILPTSKGYSALYCAESPEIWFFDFAKDKESIDPLFLEVTEGNMKTIKTEEGELLVFRRRKGLGHLRFESKTAKQFLSNAKFWSIPERGV